MEDNKDVPGVGGREFSLKLYSSDIHYIEGVDFEVVDRGEVTFDENSGTWRYYIKPISDRLKEKLGVK